MRGDAHLVFTAHSVPLAMAEASGPAGGGGRYVPELAEASRLIAERTGAGAHPWSLAYQSRSGPPSQPWLEPDVNDHLGELAKSGTRAVAVIPVGFVSDHMEVRHDLDVEAAETADSLGLAFARVATPGTSPRFASMITELVRERIAEPDNLASDSPVSDNTGPGCAGRGCAGQGCAGQGCAGQGCAGPLAALGDMGVPSQTCPAGCCGGTR